MTKICRISLKKNFVKTSLTWCPEYAEMIGGTLRVNIDIPEV